MKENKKLKDEVGAEMNKMPENAFVSPMQEMQPMVQPIICCPYLMNMQCPMVQGQYMANNMNYGQSMPYTQNMPYPQTMPYSSNMDYGQTMPYSYDNYSNNAYPYANNTGVMGQYMDNIHY